MNTNRVDHHHYYYLKFNEYRFEKNVSRVFTLHVDIGWISQFAHIEKENVRKIIIGGGEEEEEE